ncbi:MAG: methanethiol S-methyltransferase [Bacteroidota bacterium]
MKRYIFLLYGVLAYVVFLATFLYLIGFTGNLLVPKGIDGAVEVPLWLAILTNLGLIALFGAQHSIMARPWFKQWWARYLPESIERSTFVLLSCVALVVMFYFWQPMGGLVWTISHPVSVGIIYMLFASGWGLVLLSSFLINHFDLFGLRQVWLYFRKKPYTDLPFDTPLLYKFIRHPLYFGILLAFWAAPEMSVSRLFFALIFTLYALKAMQWEEKDLIKHFGETYRRYKSRIPMIIPIPYIIVKRNKVSDYETIMKSHQQEAV